MRAHRKTEHDCLQACKTTPLIKLASEKKYTILDILLSNTAVGPDVTLEHVTKALNELIDLKYPLINRILEVAAYFCSKNGLFIYCTNPSDYAELSINSGDTAGCFNHHNGLIIVSTLLPLSRILIHELTHAVRFYISCSGEEVLNRHLQFCKHKFTSRFNQALRNNNFTKEEQDELDSIESDAESMRDLAVEFSRHCSRQDLELMLERSRNGAEFFHVRRGVVEEHQKFRSEFYHEFAPYKEADRAEEFLPTFLEFFVMGAYHKKMESLRTWLSMSMVILGCNTNQIYYSSLLSLMWDSLPKFLAEDFIKSDFRTALDHYAGRMRLSAERLIDSHYYSASLAEPARINVW